MKRVPISRTPSSKQRAKNASRKPVRDAYIKAHPNCETGCGARAEHVHEPFSRGRGGPADDERNMMSICASCHQHIHTNPAESEAKGWLIPAAYGAAWLAGGGREQDRAT